MSPVRCCLLYLLCGLTALSAQFSPAAEQQPAFSLIAAGPEVFTRDLASLRIIPEQATVKRMTSLPVSENELQHFGELQRSRPQLRIILADRERVLYCCPLKFYDSGKRSTTITIGFNSKQGLVTDFGPSFEKLNETDFHRTGEQPIFLRKQDDWLLISEHRENLDFSTEQIEQLLEGFGQNHRFRFTSHFENLTDEQWRDHLQTTDQFLQTLLKDKYQGGLADDETIVAAKLVQSVSGELLRDAEQQCVKANMQFQFRDGSEAADVVKAFAAQRSRYEGVIDSEADLNVLVAAELDDRFATFCTKAWLGAAQELAKFPAASDPLPARFITAMRTAGITTFQTRHIDLAISAKRAADDWNVCAAGDVRNSELFQIFAEEIQESKSVSPPTKVSAARKRFQLDKPKVRDYQKQIESDWSEILKQVVRPARDLKPAGRVWRVRDEHLVWFPPDRVVIASPPERLAGLQEMVDAPQPAAEPLPPLLFQCRVNMLHDLLAEYLPQFAARNNLLQAFQGDERIQIAVHAEKLTLKLEASVGEQAVARFLVADSNERDPLWWRKLLGLTE